MGHWLLLNFDPIGNSLFAIHYTGNVAIICKYWAKIFYIYVYISSQFCIQFS